MEAFTCKARQGATDPPQDCDWPNCGCDPYADKVLAALEEQAPGLFAIHRDNEKMRETITRLQQLVEFTRHRSACDLENQDALFASGREELRCTCGLSDLLAGLAASQEKKAPTREQEQP
jgi:hypothetical protein